MKVQGWRRVGAMVIAAGFASSAMAGPIGSTAKSFEPTSRTALAITGPIILSTSRIIFGSGAMADLEEIKPVAVGAWSLAGEDVEAQLFRLASDPGPILNGNSICGDPVNYMAVSQAELFGSWSLSLVFFSAPEVPSSADSPGMCATFSYALDGPLPDAAEATPEEEGSVEAPEASELQPLGEEYAAKTGPIAFDTSGFKFGSGELIFDWVASISPYAGGALSWSAPHFDRTGGATVRA